MDLLNKRATEQLISYTQYKENSLTKPTFDKDNAHKLYVITCKLLKDINHVFRNRLRLYCNILYLFLA